MRKKNLFEFCRGGKFPKTATKSMRITQYYARGVFVKANDVISLVLEWFLMFGIEHVVISFVFIRFLKVQGLFRRKF